MPVTLMDIKDYIERQKQRWIVAKKVLCEDCERELSNSEKNWCKQNFQWMYCYNCQKNHSTIKSNKAFMHSDWWISFQSKYFKPKTIKNEN